MNQKTLVGMALAAVVLAALGWTLDSRRNARAAWAKADTVLFPELRGSVESAARLKVESPFGSTTVERSGEEWVVVERDGYPGRSDEVARLLVGLAEARRLEPKTQDPAKYEKLGLGGFEDDTSETVRLTVETESGGVLADLLIGRRNSRGAAEGWYVREPDDETTWSVEAKLRTPKRPGEWLQTDLFDVARDRIAEVAIEQEEGEAVRLVRAEPGDSYFEIANLPEGREARSERSGAAFLGSLANLRLQDVRPAATPDFPEAEARRTTWWTKDGLRVVAELAEVGGEEEPEASEDEDALAPAPQTELLCRFTVDFDASRAPAVDMGPELPEEDPEEDGEETDPPADPFAPQDEEPEPLSREEVEAEVATIRSVVDGWVFVLPSWKKSSFQTSWDDLLEPLPEPEEEAEEGGAESDSVPEPVSVPDPVDEGDGR